MTFFSSFHVSACCLLSLIAFIPRRSGTHTTWSIPLGARARCLNRESSSIQFNSWIQITEKCARKKNSTFRFVFNDLSPCSLPSALAECLFAQEATEWSERRKASAGGKKFPDSHQQSIAKYIIVILRSELASFCYVNLGRSETEDQERKINFHYCLRSLFGISQSRADSYQKIKFDLIFMKFLLRDDFISRLVSTRRLKDDGIPISWTPPQSPIDGELKLGRVSVTGEMKI